MEFFAGIDAHGGMNGGVEVGDGDGVLFDLFAFLFVGDSVGAHVVESASCKDEAEGGALVSASTSVVEFGGASELGSDGYEGFVEESLFFQIANECGEGGVEFLNENVLVELAFEVCVPPGAVDEIEVV